MPLHSTQQPKKESFLDNFSFKITKWIGTPQSLIVHSAFFLIILSLKFFGVEFGFILLAFTTWLSMEAIYLAIFIQMTVNRTTIKLDTVEEDIEDIQEDVQGLETDVEEISEDIDKIQVEDQTEEENTEESLENIENQMQKMIESLEHLRKQVHEHKLT